MGWFQEQIEERERLDSEALEDSFYEILNSVTSVESEFKLHDASRLDQQALAELMAFFKLKLPDQFEKNDELDALLDGLLVTQGVFFRHIDLKPGWHKTGFGALLLEDESGKLVFLKPALMGGYSYFDSLSQQYRKLSKKDLGRFGEEAIVFYPPFTQKKVTKRAFFQYLLSLINPVDRVPIAIAALIGSVAATMLPRSSQFLIETVIPNHSYQLLFGLALSLVFFIVGNYLMSFVRTIATQRLQTKIDVNVVAAAMTRLISLPVGFFAKYDSGELFSRVRKVQELSGLFINLTFGFALSLLMTVVYVIQCVTLNPRLAIYTLVAVFLILILDISHFVLRMRMQRTVMKKELAHDALTLTMLGGIQKIKLAGAERRFFAQWAHVFSERISPIYKPLPYLIFFSPIMTGINLLITFVLYLVAFATHSSAGSIFALTSTFSMMVGSVMGSVAQLQAAAQIPAIFEMVEPFFSTLPEVDIQRSRVERLNGSIEMDEVSFSYPGMTKKILDKLSLKIKANEYVAIVGKTGCGKSTLIRLLLGFETPDTGAIFYDGRDMSQLDLRSLRQKMGIVLQSAQLFQGDIFSNISLGNSAITHDEAWEAARAAAVADDIEAMPMKMFTYITDAASTVSGGQKQRILIARALAAKPKILIFDEATSALDNVSQKCVVDTLRSLKCTRIVIAHRLSTIKDCDRILYLEDGHVVEEGSFDELVALNGRFKNLVERQML